MRPPFYRFAAMITFFLLTFTSSVFAWPFGDKKKTVQASSSSTASAPAQKVQSSVSARSGNASNTSNTSAAQGEGFFEEEEGETNEIPALPQIPQVPKANVTGLPQLPQVKYAGVPQTAGTASTAPSAGLDPDILRIQKQIQEIMKINESLKTNFSGQAAEIQKISDQAKIHGEILKDLDSSRKVAEEASSEKYLNKEKLRLIREETEKNQKFLQELNAQSGSTVTVNSKAPDLLSGDSNKKV